MQSAQGQPPPSQQRQPPPQQQRGAAPAAADRGQPHGQPESGKREPKETPPPRPQ
jgi:hypothetical protein